MDINLIVNIAEQIITAFEQLFKRLHHKKHEQIIAEMTAELKKNLTMILQQYEKSIEDEIAKYEKEVNVEIEKLEKEISNYQQQNQMWEMMRNTHPQASKQIEENNNKITHNTTKINDLKKELSK